MIWYLSIAIALGGNCNLEPIETVSSTMTTLVINNHKYSVRGTRARRELSNEFAACGYSEASLNLEGWRMMRRTTNWLGAGGVLVFWPALIGIAYTGPRAAEYRFALEDSLRAQRSGR